RALHTPAPDHSADGCAIPDSRSARRSIADTAVSLGRRRDVPRSRRTSPRLLREIRRRFFYDFQVKLSVGELAPQAIVLRFQLRREPFMGVAADTTSNFPLRLRRIQFPRLDAGIPSRWAAWLMPTDSANRNASCLYSSVY